MLMVELLTGDVPYPDVTAIDAAMSNAIGDRPPDVEICLINEPRIKAIIERCWCANPIDRFTAEEILEVIHSF